MGCNGGSLMKGRQALTIQSGGVERSYLLYVPEGYDGKTPLPVLFDLHGAGATSANTERAYGFRPMADAEKFIWVAPDGLEMVWRNNAADADLLTDILARLETTGCVDRTRIYSTGCSSGAAMTNWLACNRTDVFAAIGPICGTVFIDLDKDCKPTRPISTMLVLGKEDTANCWDTADEATHMVRCAKTYQDFFKRANQCTGAIRKTHDGKCELIDGCKDGTEVQICLVDAPHFANRAADMDVPTEVWKFMSRFRRER